MLVSIIIPVYNDPILLRKCLDSIREQTFPAEKFEVIVVDNGSDESPEPIVKEFGYQFAIETKTGSYAARNLGIRMAKGKYLGFIDSDCIASPGWIEAGVRHLEENPDCGLVGGPVDIYFQDPKRPTAVELYESLNWFDFKRYIEEWNVCGAGNLFTFPHVFERVGMFDEKFKSGGDFEWSGRVHEADLPLLYREDVGISHPARYQLRQVIKRYRRMAGGHVDMKGPMETPKRPGKLLMLVIRNLLPIPAIKKLVKDPRLSKTTDRIRVIIVAMSIHYAIVLERARKRLGGASLRS